MALSSKKLAGKKRLAVARFQSGDLSGARKLCNEICRVNSSDASTWCLLACIHGRTDNFVDAVRCASKSVKISPSYDAAWVVLGHSLLELKRPDDAIRAYEQALRINSGNMEALCGLCNYFEMRHDLESAANWIKLALQKQPEHPQANLYAAILERRNGNLEGSRDRLARLLENLPSNATALKAYSEQGKLLEKLGEYGDASKAYESANRILANEYKHTSSDKRRLYQQIERHCDALKREGVSTWQAPENDDGIPDPVFMVGFPRSGTTLAEQLLAAHPGVEVSNEKPLLRNVISSIKGPGGQEDGYPYNLGRLNQSEIRHLRATYWDLAEKIPGVRRNDVLFVDKLPLNIIFIPMIYRLFPDARILFALRDPRDVCFSCYTNLFSANDAMVNFTDMLTTAELYAAVMDAWQVYRDEIPLNVYELRYEMLVAEFEKTAREIAKFLGLEWDDNVLEFYAEKNQRNVTTPSYQGVVSPVYNHAIGRWQHFRETLQPALSVLNPYVGRFGYETARDT